MQELYKILEEIIKKSFCVEIREYESETVVLFDDVEEILEKHMTDGWIPVEERLPEEGEEVLVWYEYFRYGDYNCMFQTYGIGYQYDGHWSGDVNGRKARCISWQPLPESYRPERRNEE